MSNLSEKRHSYLGYAVKLAAGLFLIFVFGRICPSWGGIAQTGIQAIGIFFGLIFLLSNAEFGLILPSLLGFLAVLLTDAYTPNSLMAATFGNSTVVQIIFAYVLCQTIIDTRAFTGGPTCSASFSFSPPGSWAHSPRSAGSCL